MLAIKGQVNVIGLEKCNLCKQCEKICPIDAIRVEKIKDSFIINVESMGGLPPERIFLESIKILKEKTDELKGFVTQIKAGKA